MKQWLDRWKRLPLKWKLLLGGQSIITSALITGRIHSIIEGNKLEK